MQCCNPFAKLRDEVFLFHRLKSCSAVIQVTPGNGQFADDAENGNRRVVGLHQTGRELHAAGSNRDIADAHAVSQARKGVGGERDVAFVAHDHMVKSRFPLQNAVKQSAGLATRYTEYVRGAALEQEFGKMIAGVHKETIRLDWPVECEC